MKRISVTAVLSLLCIAMPPAPRALGSEVRLVVIVVIDQLRADLLTRFSDHFGENGFARLSREGAHFVNAYYSHASNATAPGHATIITGRMPRQHGVVGNAWLPQAGGDSLKSAVADADCRLVSSSADDARKGCSPKALIGPALGDALKLADVRSRVYSVSLKDRAAVMLGGKRPDGVFWWDRDSGDFVSSTYYCSQLPAYVQEFNKQRWLDRFIGQTWERMLPLAAYAGCQPDDEPWIKPSPQRTAVFPHAMPKPKAAGAPDRPFNKALYAAPFGNDILLEMAKQILIGEKLGSGPAVDLLCVSFSSNDVCGHIFGPDSPEIMDFTVRTDRQIAELLDAIDAAVGLQRCLVALTADHGVTSAADVAQSLGLGGGQLDQKGVCQALNDELNGRFEPPPDRAPYVAGMNLPWIYLDRALANGDAERRRRFLEAAAAFLRTREGVDNIFTVDELSGPAPSPAELHRYLAWRAYFPGRSGEIYVQLKPFWYVKGDEVAGHTAGCTHDRHVPIMLFGPGVRPGRHFTPADPADIPVTLAMLLGIEPPLDAVGRVLHEALGDR